MHGQMDGWMGGGWGWVGWVREIERERERQTDRQTERKNERERERERSSAGLARTVVQVEYCRRPSQGNFDLSVTSEFAGF